MSAALLDDLLEWLAIPSVSTGGGEAADLERAAGWAAQRVRDAGGTCDLVTLDGGNPLVVGELRAARDDAPTVLIYGHYDVQGPGDLALWSSPPFAPEIREGRVWARGAADDKGNFLPLLRAACDLACEGALPVHVRVLIEGEEEAGSDAVNRWVRQDERGADAAIVFDSGMADERTPAITLGLRGVVMATVEVRTAARDLHSGLYGGTVLNAVHALHAALGAVLPGPDGRVRDELREGVVAPGAAEVESWNVLPTGDALLGEAGARAVDPRAAAEFHARTGAEPALDVNQIVAGEPRTVIPAVARATLSVRLAPRQEAGRIAGVLEDLLRSGLPEGAELRFTVDHVAHPALFGPDEPAVRLAVEALERACGVRPALVRTGGSIPVVAELAARGIPTIVTGFVLPDDAFHAPDESFSLRSLELGERAGRELLLAFAAL